MAEFGHTTARLVEVKPFAHMQALIDGLEAKGCEYENVMLQRSSDLNVSVLFKKGVGATNPRFIADSDLGEPEKCNALDHGYGSRAVSN